MSARVVQALVGLELRRVIGSVAEGILVFLGLTALAWLLRGSNAQFARGLPDFVILVVVPLFATAQGADALAHEHAGATWSFLRARAVSPRVLVGVKIAVRLAAIVALALVVALLVAGPLTDGSLTRLHASGLSVPVALRLSALLTVTGFACGLLAGARLHDPLTATCGGGLVAACLILLLLLPGFTAHGAWTWLLGGTP